MAVKSAGTVRNRRENIVSQRDKSPEKDNNLVRKRNNKADSPILPDAFKCETYWLTRIVFLRSLAFVYFVAFLVALNQNKQLIGSNGLLPIPNFFKMVKNHFGAQFRLASFQAVPTLLWAVNPENIDFYLDMVAYAGILISLFILYFGCANMFMMLTLWILYHSLVNIGQRWYSFGWESQLLETGFLAIFLCPVVKLQQIPVDTPTPVVVKLGYRWLLFRIMFGAGMIKIRGDQCWRDLTCMNYHYQTQPVPNPLSYYFHQSPEIFHKFETLSNHFIELIAPWFLMIPGRPTMLCGAIQIVFQVVLILSGNLSFLNWLTILPSIMCFNDHNLSSLFSTTSFARQEVNRLNKLIHEGKPPKASKGLHIRWVVEAFLGLLLVFLSIPVVQNLFSSRQVMNTSFETLRIVNTYGAFGRQLTRCSVTKERTEIILQGTRNSTVHGNDVVWRDYEFKCKPGDVMRRPCFISPYHYRLDWLMWFAAFQRIQDNPWLIHLTAKLLNNDPGATSLIAINPFENGDPPRYIRAEHYLYEFTKIGDSKAGQSQWWSRRYIRPYFPPISLKVLRQYMQSQDINECMDKTANCSTDFDCVDTIGSFECVCRGLIQDGDCIREGFVRYHIELTVIEPFNDSLCIQNSTAFAEFQTRFNESIKVVYAGDPSFVSVKINELRDGKNDKVIIDAYMTYRVPDSLNLLFEAVRNNSLPNFNVSNNELRVVVTGTCASSTCPANSTCQRLTRRTYTCPCEDGFYEDGFNCTELVNVNVQLTIAREFTTSLRNSSSEEFKQLNTSLHQALTQQFQDTPNFQDIKILGFRNGSTIVDFSVRYRRDPSQNVKVVVANTLYEKVTKPGRIGNFTVEKAEINGTPPPPQGLMATGVAVTSINVTWQQPDSFNVFGIQHYQTRLNPERPMNEKNITATMGTNNATFQNLLDSTSYAISVYAVNDDGLGDVAMITVTTNGDINECNNSALFSCPPGLTCVNTLGSFRCICEGVVGSDGSCTRQGAVELNRIFLTVNRTFTPGFANKSSSDFREFQDEFRTSMEAVYNTRQFGFVQAVINELRAGSVIVDADVTFDQVGANGLSVLFTAVRNRMVGTFNVSSNALVVVITGTCNDITCHANSTCLTLSPTTVECRCLPGFYPNGLQCLELVNVIIKITLDGEFTSDLNDNTSALFIELAGNLTRELRDKFEDTPNFQDVEILRFRNGSIIVDVRIILRQSPQNAKVIVADSFIERLINGTLSGLPIQGATVAGPPPPPQDVTITHVGEKSITFTWQHRASFVAFGITIYEIRSNPPLPGNALRNRTPEVATLSETFGGLESDTFYTINITAINDDGSAERLITAKTDDDSDDTTLIVVLVVVLSFVLIAIIMLVLFFRHRRRQKQVYQTSGGRRRPSINMDDHWRNQYDNAGQDI